MQNYKDQNNNIHVLDSIEFEHLLPAGCVKITQVEADAISRPLPTLTQAQSIQAAKIETAYNAAIQLDVTYMGKVFQADSISQDRLLKSLVALGGTVPSGFFWASLDNSAVPMTFAQLQGLSAVMMAQGWAAFQKMKALKDQIRAATDINAVALIVW